MSELDTGDAQDKYLSSVKEAKKVNSVVKLEFANFASGIPDGMKIFAYEGPDDKTIYYHWIRRLRSGLSYVPYVCKNKSNALQLFDSLKEDRTNLLDRAYFFVDHDFDGLQGRESHARVFVTEKYSVENYVVDANVLDDLLVFEFHCINDAQRMVIKEIFEKVYADFLLLTKELNFKIFVARKCKIRQIGDLPGRINLLAKVELNNVSSVDENLERLVVLIREPTAIEYESLRAEFDELEPKSKYRGKFALLFFAKWLGLLRKERLTENSALFSNGSTPEFSVKGDFSFDSIAPKSLHPEGLSEFLLKVA